MRNARGFTLVEMIMALVVLSMVISAAGYTYYMFRQFWTKSSKEISCQSEGRAVINRIGRDVRNGYGISMNNVTDNSLRISDSDGKMSSYTYVEEVASNNSGSIYYDSDASTSGGKDLILPYVYQRGTEDVFQYSGGEVIINFRVRDPDDADAYQGSDFSLRTYPRNV